MEMKKTGALFLVLIMLSSSILFFIGYDGGGGSSDSSQYERNIVLEHDINSISDALRFAPSGIMYAQYVNLSGIEDTYMGISLDQSFEANDPLHNRELYGVPIVKDFRAIYIPGLWFGFHDVGGKRIQLNRITYVSSYGEMSIYENGTTGFVTATKPIIFGSLPQTIQQKSIIDAVIDAFEGYTNGSAYDNYGPMLSLIDDNAQWSRIYAMGLNNYTDSYYSGVTYMPDGTYKITIVMNTTGEVNDTELAEYQNNASQRGLSAYKLDIQGNYVIINARTPTWTIVLDELSYMGAL